MKIVISATGNGLDSQVADIFGRCPYFIAAETEEGEIKDYKAINNPSADQSGGAGVSAAKIAADNEAEAVITGNIGPRAKDVLKQFGISVYSGKGSIEDVLREFEKGSLSVLD